MMRLILRKNGLDIVIEDEEVYAIVIKASTGEIKFDEIKDWIQSKIIILK